MIYALERISDIIEANLFEIVLNAENNFWHLGKIDDLFALQSKRN